MPITEGEQWYYRPVYGKLGPEAPPISYVVQTIPMRFDKALSRWVPTNPEDEDRYEMIAQTTTGSSDRPALATARMRVLGSRALVLQASTPCWMLMAMVVTCCRIH